MSVHLRMLALILITCGLLASLSPLGPPRIEDFTLCGWDKTVTREVLTDRLGEPEITSGGFVIEFDWPHHSLVLVAHCTGRSLLGKQIEYRGRLIGKVGMNASEFKEKLEALGWKGLLGGYVFRDEKEFYSLRYVCRESDPNIIEYFELELPHERSSSN